MSHNSLENSPDQVKVHLLASNQSKIMNWVKPDFEEINLSMEVTAYVNVGK